MQVVPGPVNVNTVGSQNDLKPTISTFRSFSKMSPLVVSYSTAPSTKLENNSITAKASHPQRLGLEHAKRDDVSFLEGRVFGAIGQPYKGRLSKRLAGSQSEAQPPGARMAVREKTVTRCASRVKPCATSCGQIASATRSGRGRAVDMRVLSPSFILISRLRYDITVIHSCDSTSMSGRARAFGGIQGAESVSRRRRRFSSIPTTPTNVPISPFNIARSVG